MENIYLVLGVIAGAALALGIVIFRAKVAEVKENSEYANYENARDQEYYREQMALHGGTTPTA